MTTTYPDIRYAGGPTYGGVLFPFTYSNGTIDLPSSWLPSKNLEPANEGCCIRKLGGDSLVQYIGPNFKNYIYNVTSFGGWKVQNTTSITVYQAGVVTKVQQLGSNNLPTINDASFKVSTNKPSPDFTVYNSSYLFDKPLVISALASNGGTPTTIYITFYTQWDH